MNPTMNIRVESSNAAATRGALEALVQYWQWGGYDAALEAELKQRAMDALAIPPRNCDLIADEDDAWAEFVDSLDEGDAVTAKKALRWLYKEAEDAKEPVEI